MSRQVVAAVTLFVVTSVGLAAEPPKGPVPEIVRKAVLAKHPDAVLVMVYAQVKIDGAVVDGMYHFWSAAGKVQVGVRLDDRGKAELTAASPAAAPLGNPLTGAIPSLTDGLAAAKKQGLAAGLPSPTGGSGPIIAMLLAEDGKGVWRFTGADKAGGVASIQVAGAAGSAPAPAVTGDTDERVPPTPENIAKVLKFRVGPDVAGVSASVTPRDLVTEIVLTGKVPHPGVKLQIQRAITRWTDCGSPKYDDSRVVAPGGPGLVNSFVPGGSTQPGFFSLSRDGRRLAMHKGDRQTGAARADIVVVWDTATRQPVLTFLTPPLAPKPYSNLQRLALSPDGAGGAAVITAENRAAVVFFGDAAAAKPVPLDDTLTILGLAVAPGGKAVAFGATSGLVRLVRDGQSADLPIAAKYGPTACRWQMEFSPDGKRLAVGEIDTDTVTVWDVATAKEVHKVTRPKLSVKALGWSGDGRRLAVGAEDGDAVVVFEPAAGKATVLAGISGYATWLSLSADGSKLASLHYGPGVGLWDVDAGKLVNALEWDAAGESFAAFADGGGKTLLTGVVNSNSEVRRWDLGGATAHNPVLAGGVTAVLGVYGKLDAAGDLLVTVEYRIAGMVGKDCVIVASLKDAAGKPIPARPGSQKGPDGGMVLTVVVRPDADPTNAYRVMRMPRALVPAGPVTADVNIAAGGGWLADKPLAAQVKAN